MSDLSEGQSQVFHIPEFTQNQLELLRDRTSQIIWPNELEKDYGWTLGAPTWAVKPLVEQWVHGYDWQVPRAEMQRWHHYQMKVDGLLMHYVHERSSHTDAIPIVLLHGWPSTFYEFHKLIEPLRDGIRGNQVGTRKKKKKKKKKKKEGRHLYFIVFPCHCTKFTWIWIFRST
jgi:epoxide hydrolase